MVSPEFIWFLNRYKVEKSQDKPLKVSNCLYCTPYIACLCFGNLGGSTKVWEFVSDICRFRMVCYGMGGVPLLLQMLQNSGVGCVSGGTLSQHFFIYQEWNNDCRHFLSHLKYWVSISRGKKPVMTWSLYFFTVNLWIDTINCFIA